MFNNPNMMNFWINFITTGDPNGNRRDVLPEWPKISSAILAQQQYMLLNQPGLSSGMGYRSDKLSLLAQVESLAYRYKQAPILPSSSSSSSAKLSGGKVHLI